MSDRKVLPLGDEVLKLRLIGGWTNQEDFARDCDLSKNTIIKIEKSIEVRLSSLVAVAQQLRVDVTTLISPRSEISLAAAPPQDSPFSSSEAQRAELEAFLRSSGFVEQLKKKFGEDKTFAVVMFSAGFVAVLLSGAGVLPINAKPYYIAGLGVSLIALGLAARRNSRHGTPPRFGFPAAGLLCCITATIFWPRTFGLYPSRNGLHLRFGTRVAYSKTYDTREFGHLEAKLSGTMQFNVPYSIRYTPERDHPVTLTVIFGLPLPSRYPLFEGNQWCDVTLVVGLKDVESRRVFVPPETEGEVILEFAVPPPLPDSEAFFTVQGIEVHEGDKFRPLGKEFELLVDGKHACWSKDCGTMDFFPISPGMHTFTFRCEGHEVSTDIKMYPAGTLPPVARVNIAKVRVPKWPSPISQVPSID